MRAASSKTPAELQGEIIGGVLLDLKPPVRNQGRPACGTATRTVSILPVVD